MSKAPLRSSTADAPTPAPTDWRAPAMQRRLRRRYAAERRFRIAGLAAIMVSVGFLAFLLVTMLGSGLRGFQRTDIALPIDFRAAGLDLAPARLIGRGADLALASIDLSAVLDRAATTAYGNAGPGYFSEGAADVMAARLKADPALVTGRTTLWLPAATGIDTAAKSDGSAADEATAARLKARGVLSTAFDLGFFTGADATDPATVGIWGALKGSLFTMLVTLGLAFPVGVLAALYLEEYAPRNRWTDLIEVSINNLAAVPSIIFGLLGLAVFLNTFHLPRSAALVGGLTLALMTMPVIVIAGRNAIKAVPPSIRDAALALGASPVQVVFHHVLPLAMPGILTGTIIGMARALGETAPLLMIGMRAFIATPPDKLSDPATVLPVQIFLWSDEISPGFIEKTSAAILVLLAFLLAMNALAIYLRNRFETRW